MYFRAAAACGAALVFAGCWGAPTTETPPPKVRPGGDLMSMRVEDESAVKRPTKKLTRPVTPDEAEDAIARYEQALVQDPDNPENADEMLALANLYRQKRLDYARAAQWYREYANNYATAENPKAGQVYAQLLYCYEQLKADEQVIETCMQMLKVFPPESQEYRYADKLIHG